MALWAREVSWAFEKRAPEEQIFAVNEAAVPGVLPECAKSTIHWFGTTHI